MPDLIFISSTCICSIFYKQGCYTYILSIISLAVSDATFFSEEDAKSVKELVRIFTPRDLCDVPEAESNADRNVAEKDIESESKIRDAKIMKTTIGRKAATNPTSPETNKQSSNQVIHKLNKSEIHESIKVNHPYLTSFFTG